MGGDPAGAAPVSTGTPLLTGVQLHDSTQVLQSFAQNPADGTWIFAQQTQAGRFGQPLAYHRAHGNLTLTRVSADGTRQLGYMFLRDFDHGASIGLQPTSGGKLLVWAGAMAKLGPSGLPDALGTQVARFRWASGRTIWPTSSGVRLWDPFPGSSHVQPSLYWPDRLLAVRHVTAAGHLSYAVFSLWAFRDGNFTPMREIPAIRPPGTSQGWALLPGGSTIALLTGDHASGTNPPPGDTLLTVFGPSGIISQRFLAEIPDATWREPEGVQPLGGRVCNGWGTGPSFRHVAGVYCRAAP